jgi:tetratricopeptide (TPR) repeat protein
MEEQNVKICLRNLEINPEDVDSLLILGAISNDFPNLKLPPSIHFFEKAAKLGNIQGMFECSNYYGKTNQFQKQIYFLQKASEFNDGKMVEGKDEKFSQVQSQLRFAVNLEKEGSFKDAEKYYKLASKHEHPSGTEAKSLLGFLYLHKLKDFKKAKEIFEECVPFDNTLSLKGLHTIYLGGLGVEPNIQKAEKYLAEIQRLGGIKIIKIEHKFDLRARSLEGFVNKVSILFCDKCNKGDRFKKLLVCGNCKSARYCDSQCQKSHWSTHKSICKKPTAPKVLNMKDFPFMKLVGSVIDPKRKLILFNFPAFEEISEVGIYFGIKVKITMDDMQWIVQGFPQKATTKYLFGMDIVNCFVCNQTCKNGHLICHIMNRFNNAEKRHLSCIIPRIVHDECMEKLFAHWGVKLMVFKEYEETYFAWEDVEMDCLKTQNEFLFLCSNPWREFHGI